jgi:hypothetical protein
VVYRRATRSRRQSRQPRTEIAPVNRPVVTLLVASLVIYLLLQFKFSIPLYDALSVVKVIAYPYRMMTFIVPLALILAVMVADWYLRAYKARWPEASRLLPAGLAGLWLLSFVLFSPVTAHEPPAASDSIFPYSPFLPVAALTPPAHSTFSTSTESPLFTEYLPKVKLPSGQPLTYDNQLYASLNSHHTESESLSSVRCSVVQLQGSAFESLRVSYGVSCAAPTLFALPISYNPFTTITRVVPGQPDRRMAIVHVATDPRIVIRVPSAGPATYVCQLPTLAGILFGS